MKGRAYERLFNYVTSLLRIWHIILLINLCFQLQYCVATITSVNVWRQKCKNLIWWLKTGFTFERVPLTFTCNTYVPLDKTNSYPFRKTRENEKTFKRTSSISGLILIKHKFKVIKIYTKPSAQRHDSVSTIVSFLKIK